MRQLKLECTRAEALQCVAALPAVAYAMTGGQHFTTLTINTPDPEGTLEGLLKAEAFDPTLSDWTVI